MSLLSPICLFGAALVAAGFYLAEAKARFDRSRSTEPAVIRARERRRLNR
jgi:hypothetical protein